MTMKNVIKSPVGVLQFAKYLEEPDTYQPSNPKYVANIKLFEDEYKIFLEKIRLHIKADEIIGENSDVVVYNKDGKKYKLYRKTPTHTKGDGISYKFASKCKDYLITDTGKIDNKPFIINKDGNKLLDDAQLEGASCRLVCTPTPFKKLGIIGLVLKGVIIEELPDGKVHPESNELSPEETMALLKDDIVPEIEELNKDGTLALQQKS